MTYPHPLTSARSGVFGTPADLDQLTVAAQRSGLVWAEVALGAEQAKAAALTAIANAVGAPGAWFGANWDALADVLQDLSWHEAAGLVLRLRGLESAHPSIDRATLLDVLRTSAAYWQARGKPFFAFVDNAPELPAWR